MTTIDIEFYCTPCGKTWTYTQVPIASAELVTEWYDRHQHTPEQLAAYYQTDPSFEGTSYEDDEDQ